MGWVGAAVAIAGVAMQAVGQFRQQQGAAQAADYNAAMARYEAKYQRQKAEFEEQEHRRDVARFIGEQTVRGAAAGGTGTGTDFSVLLDTLTQAEMDAALIRYGGAVESWRYESQSELYEKQAKGHRISSFLDPAGTILGAAGRYDFSPLATKTPGTSFSPSSYRWSPRTASGMGSSLRWAPRRY